LLILLCTDGSKHSEDAASTLVALGPPHDARIVALHVGEPLHLWVTPRLAPPYQHEWHRVKREIEAEAESVAQRALDRITHVMREAGLAIETVRREGYPAEEIVRTAEERQADLVVVGAKGFTGSQLFELGSVSQKVMKYAPCSVLMTRRPPNCATLRIGMVVLATDGSEHSLAAARLLSAFRLSSDALVRVLHVLPAEPNWLAGFAAEQLALEQLRQARVETATEIVERTKDELRTESVVTTEVLEGRPAEEILRASSEVGADLIVMGSKGLGAIQRFLLGSVSQKVSRYAGASVLVAKKGQDKSAA
jgi:nucleotide-binding universal stress UspA family protein